MMTYFERLQGPGMANTQELITSSLHISIPMSKDRSECLKKTHKILGGGGQVDIGSRVSGKQKRRFVGQHLFCHYIQDYQFQFQN